MMHVYIYLYTPEGIDPVGYNDHHSQFLIQMDMSDLPLLAMTDAVLVASSV